MKILYVFADNESEWNTSQWRCYTPAAAINKHTDATGEPYGAQMMSYDDFAGLQNEATDRIEWADVVVIERLLIGASIPRILELEAAGKIVVGDMDDSYKHMPKTVKTYPFWHEGVVKVRDEKGNPQQMKMAQPPIEQLNWNAKILHAITSPSSVILKDWSGYTDSTYLVPNFINSAMYLKYKRPRPKTDDELDKKFIIGWGGSHTHLESWKDSGVIDALRKVCAEHRNVVIRVGGGDPRVAEAIDIPGRVFPQGFVEYEEWPKLLGEYDLGLVPLAGEYDNRRSWIKTLEYTLMGIPWIGSKMAPTEELAAYGTRVKNNAFEWKKALLYAIENYSEARKKVESGFEFAMAQDMDANIDKLLNIYREITHRVKGETNEAHN